MKILRQSKFTQINVHGVEVRTIILYDNNFGKLTSEIISNEFDNNYTELSCWSGQVAKTEYYNIVNSFKNNSNWKEIISKSKVFCIEAYRPNKIYFNRTLPYATRRKYKASLSSMKRLKKIIKNPAFQCNEYTKDHFTIRQDKY